jgi:hypothetical protein
VGGFGRNRNSWSNNAGLVTLTTVRTEEHRKSRTCTTGNFTEHEIQKRRNDLKDGNKTVDYLKSSVRALVVGPGPL